VLRACSLATRARQAGKVAPFGSGCHNSVHTIRARRRGDRVKPRGLIGSRMTAIMRQMSIKSLALLKSVVQHLEFRRKQTRRHKRTSRSSSVSTTKFVCAHRGDGVATRLLTIIYARIFAEAIGFDLKVIWPKLGHPHSLYYGNSRLFDPELKHKIFSNDYVFEDATTLRGDFVSKNSIDSGRTLSSWDERERPSDIASEEFQARSNDFDVVWYDRPYPLLQSLTFDVDFPSEVKRLWKCIGWNRAITQFIDEISARLPLREFIAVHVRRGDIVKMLIEADIEHLRHPGMVQIFQRYTAIDTVISAIDRIRNGEKILLACEDRKVKALLVRKYGADAVYSTYDLFSGAGGQRAIVDIILLSKAKILIGPFISYFSKCAGEVGDCRYIPLELDLPPLVEELLEIANLAHDERQSSVKALICKTAAELASDELMRSRFEEGAQAFAR
jgi:hypothetical protein